MKQSEWIHQVVAAFYEHIPRIAAFWDIQLLGSTEKTLTEPFDVMKVHIPLQIKRGELGRWLVLFRKTLEEEVVAHPEFNELKELWLTRLIFFEGVFLRFFGFN